jgi:Tol biopolymer transport system component
VRFRPIGCLLVLLTMPFMLARPAGAVLELDITQGVIEPLPIAITEFYGETAEAQKLGTDIADVVSADLERSGLFRPLGTGASNAATGAAASSSAWGSLSCRVDTSSRTGSNTRTTWLLVSAM